MKCDTQHKRHNAEITLNITTISIECHYAECRISLIVILNVIMLSVMALT
jgi:hypothetical protein